MIVVEFTPFRRFLLAAVPRVGTARMEFSARRRVDRARNFAFQLNRGFLRIRVEMGNGGEQRLGARPEAGSGP